MVDACGTACWAFDDELRVSAEAATKDRSEEHTSELQSQSNLVCRLLLEKKKSRQVPSTATATPTGAIAAAHATPARRLPFLRAAESRRLKPPYHCLHREPLLPTCVTTHA